MLGNALGPNSHTGYVGGRGKGNEKRPFLKFFVFATANLVKRVIEHNEMEVFYFL